MANLGQWEFLLPAQTAHGLSIEVGQKKTSASRRFTSFCPYPESAQRGGTFLVAGPRPRRSIVLVSL